MTLFGKRNQVEILISRDIVNVVKEIDKIINSIVKNIRFETRIVLY